MSYWPKHRMKSLLTAVAWREPEKLQQQPNLEPRFLTREFQRHMGGARGQFVPSARRTKSRLTTRNRTDQHEIQRRGNGSDRCRCRWEPQSNRSDCASGGGGGGRGGRRRRKRRRRNRNARQGDATVAEDTLLEALASIAALCGEARVVRIMIDPSELHDSFSGLAWLGKLLRVVIDHVDRLGSSSSSSSSSPEEKEAEAAAVVSGRFHAQLMLLCASLLSSALEVTQMDSATTRRGVADSVAIMKDTVQPGGQGVDRFVTVAAVLYGIRGVKECVARNIGSAVTVTRLCSMKVLELWSLAQTRVVEISGALSSSASTTAAAAAEAEASPKVNNICNTRVSKPS